MTKYGEQLIKIDYKWGKMLTYETGTGKKVMQNLINKKHNYRLSLLPANTNIEVDSIKGTANIIKIQT